MNIYLAGPITGIADGNRSAFAVAAKRLREDGHFVFNPAESNPPEQSGYRACMAVDLAWICSHAGAVFVLPDWETSKGVRAEVALAECLGLMVKLI